MSENVFLRDKSFYKRSIDPVNQYIEQTSFYLSKMTGNDLDVCKQVILDSIKKEDSEVIDPIVHYFERDDVGDRHKEQTNLTSYINEVIRNDEILAPTMTTYINPKQRKSLLVGFVDHNVERRSIAKKQAFKAEFDGKKELFIIKDNEQTNMKLYNNSMSGAFSSKSSVLYNP